MFLKGFPETCEPTHFPRKWVGHPACARRRLTAATIAGALTIFFIVSTACRVYKPMPLNRETVERALQPPSDQAVRSAAGALNHPILQPIAFDDRDGLSPDEAAVLAVLANPGLRAERDRRGLADAALLEAGLLPNPQLSASLEIPTGGLTQGTVNGYGLGLGWDVSALLSRSARVRSSTAERAAVDLEVAWQEWQTAQAAKLSVYRLLVLEQKIALAREMDDNQALLIELLRQALQEGQSTAPEVGAAVSIANQAHLTRLDLERENEQEKNQLLRLLGQPADAEVRLQEGVVIPTLLLPGSAESLLAGLEDRRLDLVALRQGYESEEQTLRAECLDQFPAVNLEIVHARDTGDVITTGPGVTIDLPIFNRNQGRIAQEKATRQALFDEYVSRVAEARADVAALLAEAYTLNEQIRAGIDAGASLSGLADTYREALRQGQADRLTYLEAMTGVEEKELEVLTLQGQLLETRIALELATGRYQIEAENEYQVPEGGNREENL